MDSTLWNDFEFREGDIVVGTYAKTGTSWMQQIIGQLLFDGDARVNVQDLSPWWELRFTPPEARAALEKQPHRRVLKTHLPADALVISPKAKYIYICRDGRDVAWSLHNHHSNFREEAYAFLNGPGLVGHEMPRPDPDTRSYYRTWLEKDGYPFWPFWENVASWWALRDLPNVKLIHFARLKADLSGEMLAIAKFLGVTVSPDRWDAAVEHCTFEWMKRNAAQVSPMGGALFEGGADAFINKGVNGRWRDVLCSADIEHYDQLALRSLGADCARWLASGQS